MSVLPEVAGLATLKAAALSKATVSPALRARLTPLSEGASVATSGDSGRV